MNRPFAFGPPPAQGKIKSLPEDFLVEERLGFEPEGEGEHLWLLIEKRCLTTEEVAWRLAKILKVPRREVGYSGLKDSFAVARQWFSVRRPGHIPSWSGWAAAGFRVLQASWHRKRLKTGIHRANRFEIKIRELSGKRREIERRLEEIAQEGVPNYFGPQRYGRSGENLKKARALLSGERFFRDRHLRALLISSARAFLFDELLAERVRLGIWNRALPGDLLMFSGSRAFFHAGEIDREIVDRLNRKELHPTGPLWGLPGKHRPSGRVAELEAEIGVRHADLARPLELLAEEKRRPLRLVPEALSYRWEGEALLLTFQLPPGGYATTLLREVIGDR